MRKKRVTLWSTVALSALTCWAQPEPEAPREGREGPPRARREEEPERALGRILNEEQRAQMREMMRVHGDGFREIEEKLRETRRALHDTALKEEASDDELKEHLGQIARLEAEQRFRRLKIMRRIRSSLTPEQIERLKELRERRSEGADFRRPGVLERRSVRRLRPRAEEFRGSGYGRFERMPRFEGPFREWPPRRWEGPPRREQYFGRQRPPGPPRFTRPERPWREEPPAFRERFEPRRPEPRFERDERRRFEGQRERRGEERERERRHEEEFDDDRDAPPPPSRGRPGPE